MTTKQVSALRMTGSFCLCAAYPALTTGRITLGVLLNLLGQLLLLPFGVKTRSWDLLALGAFFISINLKVLCGL